MSGQGTPRKTRMSGRPPARRRPIGSARASDPEGVSPGTHNTHEVIAACAYEHFLARGGQHGDDWGDWFRAEADLQHRRALEGSGPKRSPR